MLVKGTGTEGVFFTILKSAAKEGVFAATAAISSSVTARASPQNDVSRVSADNTYHIVITTDNSVCTMYINDQVCYTNRIYGIQRNCWSINSYSGTIEVSGLKVAGL